MPVHGRLVVVEVVNRAFTDVGEMCHNVMLHDGAGEFQVTVGDATVGVGGGDELGDHRRWELGAPKDRMGEEENTAHALARGIASTNGYGRRGNQFGEADRPGGKVMSQPAEVVEEGVGGGIESEATAGGKWVAKGDLEGAEQTTRPRDGQGHGAEFTKQAVPGLSGDPALGWGDGGQKGVEAVQAMGRKFDGLGQGIK